MAKRRTSRFEKGRDALRGGCWYEDCDLRRGQWAAAFATLAHFSASENPALLVLPTGLGKTAVMTLLPYLLHKCERVLVVAPTRVVRRQIVSEFRSLAVLRGSRVFQQGTTPPAPTVKVVASRLSTEDAWRRAAASDVVVGLPQSLSPSMNGVCQPPRDLFDLVVVDEAHHVEARTWEALVNALDAKKVYLTATPFRRDRRRLHAETVYHYPLAQALKDGLYAPIEYRPVTIDPQEDRDHALALAARGRLRSATHKTQDSRVLVRTDRVAEAERLKGVYEAIDVPLGVVTGELKEVEIDAEIERARNGETLGIIFVGVLGEGFDLPALKIAVYHRPHQSLPATLQFVGRVARTTGAQSAQAELLAPADDRPQLLRALYSDRADWNLLLPKLFELAASKARKDVSFMLHGHGVVDAKELRPFFAARVFKAPVDFSVDISTLEVGVTRLAESTVEGVYESDGSTVAIVTRRPQAPRWYGTDLPFGELAELSIVVRVKLASGCRLFFYSSDRGSTADAVLAALCGDEVELLRPVGTVELQKALGSLKPERFLGVGLRSGISRSASYRTVVGRDASRGISVQEARTHFFGHAMALGASRDALSGSPQVGISLSKSSIWQSAWGTIEEYRSWCFSLGSAMLAKAKPPSLPLRVAFPEMLESLPAAKALGAVLDPWFLVDREGREVFVATDDGTVGVGATSIAVRVVAGELRFSFWHDGKEVLSIAGAVDGSFRRLGGGRLHSGQRSSPLVEGSVFANHPPLVFFDDGSVIHGHVRFSPKAPGDALLQQEAVFDVLDWSGCEKKAEKPGNVTGRDLSVFDFVTNRLRAAKEWKYIVEDDGAHEIGDFLAISPGDDRVRVLIVHCKAMKTSSPGVDCGKNLYDVVAQAIRSQNHLQMPPSQFWPEVERRLDERTGTSLTYGPKKKFAREVEKWGGLRLDVDVAIVQPGLSFGKLKQKSGRNARILLESVLTLAEQTGGSLEVWCSD